MKFQDKNANFWKWGIEIALGCFILVIGWSTYHLSPSLFVIAVAICAAEFLVTIVYTVFTTVPDTERRHRAWCCIGIVASSLAFNAIIHATLSRKYDIAEQNRKVKQIEKRENLQLKQIESELEIRKNQSNKLLEEQKERNLQLQNRQLAMVNRDYRRPLIPPAPLPTIEITSVNESTYTISENKKETEKPVILSPEEVQDSAFGWVIAGIILAISAVIGTGIGFIRILIRTTNEEEKSRNESLALPEFRAQIRTHLGSPNFQGEAPSRGSLERLPREAPEPLQNGQSEALQSEAHWMDFYRVGDWDMPPISACQWKWNTGQRSIELYKKTDDKPEYLGRFGVSVQEIWKSLSETERVNFIKSESAKWIKNWKEKKGVA